MTEIHSCLGALALELSPGTKAERSALDQGEVGELAALIARDLAKVAPIAAQLDLGLIAALFDPVELLRPRWPLHRELERLIAQAPQVGEARVIGFAGRDGELPESLRPDPDFAGGALRLVPLVLRGDATVADDVDAILERTLLDIGMAGADTALLAQHAFGASIEHARYLTVHDLAAMMAMQYDNVGLGALWPLIEAALLAPERELWLDAPPEPLVRLIAGEAHIALLDSENWVRWGWSSPGVDAERLARAFDRFQMRQRQIANVLEAHGICVSFDHCQAGTDPRAQLCT
jgi:hypothetical protein